MKESKRVKMQVICNGEKPSYFNEFAAGLDLRSNENKVIRARGCVDIKSKISVAIPKGHFGMIVPRSGLGFKHRITLVNDVGVIDEDYRGEIGIRLLNEGYKPYEVKRGDRIAQMIIIPYIQPDLEFVEELDETERGEGGFGHSGK